jgi:hypothetical protein
MIERFGVLARTQLVRGGGDCGASDAGCCEGNAPAAARRRAEPGGWHHPARYQRCSGAGERARADGSRQGRNDAFLVQEGANVG